MSYGAERRTTSQPCTLVGVSSTYRLCYLPASLESLLAELVVRSHILQSALLQAMKVSSLLFVMLVELYVEELILFL